MKLKNVGDSEVFVAMNDDKLSVAVPAGGSIEVSYPVVVTASEGGEALIQFE